VARSATNYLQKLLSPPFREGVGGGPSGYKLEVSAGDPWEEDLVVEVGYYGHAHGDHEW
jgi:hypothetical protein